LSGKSNDTSAASAGQLVLEGLGKLFWVGSSSSSSGWSGVDCSLVEETGGELGVVNGSAAIGIVNIEQSV
jgi:hypothetical protein